MNYCDNCNECIDSEYTFNNFIITYMFHNFQNYKKLQNYLVKELKIRLDVIENYLEEFSSICCHTFCNNCFKFYNIEEYEDTEGYFELYKLALKTLFNFSCKKCEDLKIYESIKDEFKEFRQITKTKLELLKTNKNDCSEFIDAFIDKYLKDE